jgi:hypothetical protein
MAELGFAGRCSLYVIGFSACHYIAFSKLNNMDVALHWDEMSQQDKF